MRRDEFCEEEFLMDEEARRLADEFIEQAQADVNPGLDPEEFLARYPQHEARLRPVVEGAARLFSEMRRFKRQHPGMTLLDILKKYGR